MSKKAEAPTIVLIEPKKILVRSDFAGVSITSRALSLVAEMSDCEDWQEFEKISRRSTALMREIHNCEVCWTIEKEPTR